MSKKRVAIDSFDSASIGNEGEYLQSLIATNDFMVFMKTGCPLSFKLKHLLESFDVKFSDLYLDNHVNGPRLQGKLNDWTNQETPYVYVKKIFIGGYKETAELLATGLLRDAIGGIDLNKFEYDLVVIGGGNAGIAAALEAVKYGKKVALCSSSMTTHHGTTWGIGNSPAGSGSISKEIFHRAATIRHDFTDGKFFGWEIENYPTHNWSAMAQNLSEQLNSAAFEHQKNLRESGVEYLNGWARFNDSHSVTVTESEGQKREITSRTFIIATGSKHRNLEIPGEEENTLTVEDLLSLPKFEGKRALIIGSGCDAFEIAGFLGGFDIDTTVVIRRKMLPCVDKEMAERLRKSVECQGVKFVSGVTVTSINQMGNTIHVEGKLIRSDQIRGSKMVEFSQRKLSELGSKKSPPPTPLPESAAPPTGQESEKDNVEVPKKKLSTTGASKGKNKAGGKKKKDKKGEKKDFDDDSKNATLTEADKKEDGDRKNKGNDDKTDSTKDVSKGPTEDSNDSEATVEGKSSQSEEIISEDYINEFDLVIVAAGRRPNVADLGLQNIPIKLCRETCKIVVNELDQTTVDNIFAVGRVATALHAEEQGVAKKSAQLLVRRMFNLGQLKMNYRKIPQIILTPIEYAWLGDSEEQALAVHGPKIEVFHTEYSVPTSTMSNRYDCRSYAKVICAPPVPIVGRLVVGIHLMSPGAGEILQGLTPAFLTGSLTKECFDEMVALLPCRGAVLSDLNTTKTADIAVRSNTIK